MITRFQQKLLGRIREEKGAAVVLMTLVLTAMFLMAGMAIDGSNGFLQRRRMQTAADAAALAAARQLALGANHHQVATEMHNVAMSNGADDNRWHTSNSQRTVVVNVEHAFPTYFLPLFGVSEISVKADSSASYRPVSVVSPPNGSCNSSSCGGNDGDDTGFEGDGNNGGDGGGGTFGGCTGPNCGSIVPPFGVTCVNINRETTFYNYNVSNGGTTNITCNDGRNSTYQINFVSRVDKTWTYEVIETAGARDLSHWSLGISSCLNKVVSYTSGAALGRDGSTGFVGIKWNTPGSFSRGFFSFTLDGEYPVGTLQAMAKTATVFNTANLPGPICSSGQIVSNGSTSSDDDEASDYGTSDNSCNQGIGGDGFASTEQYCKFAWLDWNGGSTSQTELRDYLDDASQSGMISINDQIASGVPAADPAIVNSRMADWLNAPATVPVIKSSTDGTNRQVCGFARFRITSFDLSANPKWIRGRFERAVVRGVASSSNAPDFGLRDVGLVN